MVDSKGVGHMATAEAASAPKEAAQAVEDVTPLDASGVVLKHNDYELLPILEGAGYMATRHKGTKLVDFKGAFTS